MCNSVQLQPCTKPNCCPLADLSYIYMCVWITYGLVPACAVLAGEELLHTMSSVWVGLFLLQGVTMWVCKHSPCCAFVDACQDNVVLVLVADIVLNTLITQLHLLQACQLWPARHWQG